jgi:hypothetical protein
MPCAFHGHVNGGDRRREGRQEGVWGNLEPGPWFSGGGGGSGFPQCSSNGLPPSVRAEWSWSDPDLTLGAPRSGGEVGIEAERSDRVLPGRRGARPESRHTAPASANASYTDSLWGMPEACASTNGWRPPTYEIGAQVGGDVGVCKP